MYLPHNSACVMWDNCQEEWKHGVPRCSNERIFCHKKSGLVRYSLTFRMAKKLPNLGSCFCGLPVTLKSFQGKYVLVCKPYGETKEKVCNYWKEISINSLRMKP